MPFPPAKPVVFLLFAILSSGCASQNAMDLVPQAVRLDIAREKAALAEPLSVEDMLAKARQGAPENVPAIKAQDTKAKDLLEQSTDVPTVGAPTAGDQAKPMREIKSVDADTVFPQIKTDASASNAGAEHDPVELFRQAMALQTEGGAEQDKPIDPIAAFKGQAEEDEWQKLLDRSMVPNDTPQPEEDVASVYPVADMSSVTASLPEGDDGQFEHVGVTFNETMTGLASADNLKIRLLRYGKRYPEAIVIGRIDSLNGFAAMQRALLLGQLVADASGGKPGISYDPALSAGSAEVRYIKTGKQP